MREPRVTQAMIDAYDAYTHVTLDRRTLIATLSKLAGSTAAAYAVLPLLEANQAQAAITAANDPRLVTKDITWPGAERGQTMKGYLAYPKEVISRRRPVVLVVHENRGLNAHIRDVTRRVALEGFIALAPDFLSPVGGTPADEDKTREAIGKLGRDQVVANAVATIAYVTYKLKIPGQTGTDSVEAIGFCWGGGMVNQIAVEGVVWPNAGGPALEASVVYYGMTPDPSKVSNIKTRMLLHFAGLDERINAGIPAYEAALKAANVPYQIYIYPGVNHAFNNDTSAARYNKAAADLAWSRTIAFLKDATWSVPPAEAP